MTNTNTLIDLVSQVARTGKVEGVSPHIVEEAIEKDLIIFGSSGRHGTRPKGRRLLQARAKLDFAALLKCSK